MVGLKNHLAENKWLVKKPTEKNSENWLILVLDKIDYFVHYTNNQLANQ